MKRPGVALVAFALLVSSGAVAQAGDKLMVYTSKKESLMEKLRDAFAQKHPEVVFDDYSAGVGKLMVKIAAERQSGKITADILWHSEVPDFYQLKKEGVWELYASPKTKAGESIVKDRMDSLPRPVWARWATPTTPRSLRPHRRDDRACSTRVSRMASPSTTPPCRGRP